MWEVITTECFDEWFLAQNDELRESIYEAMGVLEKFGPNLGRPYVDTLYGSDFLNMKELRIQHAGDPIRAFFAFDPKRCAIVLCAGNKTGVNEKRFYKEMIRKADFEYRRHLDNLEK
ncbi:type II toxin-antitoxin system RelE/ParE family toxin [Xenorhabdus bovienii]|uniref:type II toxin-antitoxin system RelE/ParE family toxin n=1 Tax=Xenorhabdus bovienii TaxID=40576 RepID=UPI0023B291EB|nr:type II toxin-antitoxin system RelE/ParE family toxin [Xenorhabdus bovienii]MDE9458281.1 type II toxin-antitoxin system RelE/ParE family toxin [Xenorhabdus bovienii]MDE9461675.1 type II toxin-antitoxin system RelE/ParE family toxin [Xenorhabdus bovienii]MDE9466110.1 type II toxin-antitoxin system RelE/ParE family toxin [Xenorhabdus bovienii]MDE9469883.1 type II toxin-antitoxin system RelE/ParE family toxin [Xenorhabdus bovienii]MDE9486668.1 type II toxin-antitoxin system RelE/ParE family to